VEGLTSLKTSELGEWMPVLNVYSSLPRSEMISAASRAVNQNIFRVSCAPNSALKQRSYSSEYLETLHIEN